MLAGAMLVIQFRPSSLPILVLLALSAGAEHAQADDGLDFHPSTANRQLANRPSPTLNLAANGNLAIYRANAPRLARELARREELRAQPMDWHRLAEGVSIAPAYSRFSLGLATPESYEANRDLQPGEMATLLVNEYGAGSILARGGLALARWADSYQTSTQIPLDTVNTATDRLMKGAAAFLRMPDFPSLNFRSEVSPKGIELGFRHTW